MSPTGTTSSAPRILVSCGEPSGDLYGAELLRSLRSSLPGLTAFGLGGDRLAAQNAVLVAHVRDLAVVGLTEVVRHLRRIRRIFRRVLEDVDREPPQVAVLIDYPDFNLRLARELHQRRVPVVYYVSPQIWAWRGGRIRSIRERVARMLVIFPFEEALYREAGVPVTFVGHPLVDLVRPAPDRAAFLAGQGLDAARPIVAVLPGSRPQEVAHNLPPLAGAVAILHAHRPDVQFAAAVAPSLDPQSLRAAFGQTPLTLIHDQTHAIVGAASIALVASGTATIETALLGTPMVVVYRVSPVTYAVGRSLVRVPHYAMVNLIAGRRVVPELMQAAFTSEAVASEALSLLDDAGRVEQMKADLAEVRQRLGEPGASSRAAAQVLPFLE